MLIAAVITLCASAAVLGTALWSLSRDHDADPVRQVLRAVAPTQLAAAVMLAAGGAVALAAPAHIAIVMLVLCVLGALGTVGAGCYQSAKVVARREAATSGAGCTGTCASCTLSCG